MVIQDEVQPELENNTPHSNSENINTDEKSTTLNEDTTNGDISQNQKKSDSSEAIQIENGHVSET